MPEKCKGCAPQARAMNSRVCTSCGREVCACEGAGDDLCPDCYGEMNYLQ